MKENISMYRYAFKDIQWIGKSRFQFPVQGCARLRFFGLTHMIFEEIQLWLNLTLCFSWLTQLRLNSNTKFVILIKLRFNSFQSELSQNWLTTHNILPYDEVGKYMGTWSAVISDDALYD